MPDINEEGVLGRAESFNRVLALCAPVSSIRREDPFDNDRYLDKHSKP